MFRFKTSRYDSPSLPNDPLGGPKQLTQKLSKNSKQVRSAIEAPSMNARPVNGGCESTLRIFGLFSIWTVSEKKPWTSKMSCQRMDDPSMVGVVWCLPSGARHGQAKSSLDNHTL